MKLFLRLVLSVSFLVSVNRVSAQFDACASAVASQVTLPYSASGQTTCGYTDDFNGTISCTSPSSLYTTGPDVFYAFTATTTGTILVQYTTTATFEYPSIIVFQGCPSSSTNATNCVGGTSASSGNISASINVTAGQTYVVMIDNWPTPPCLTSYGISIGPTPTGSLQAPCTNLGFESGTTGWFGTNGLVSDGIATAASPVYSPNSFNVFAPQTTIVSGGTDAIGLFPMVQSGGSSLMIGDGTGTGNGGASVEQLFQVTAANSSFTYYYACVLQDALHPNYQQPFFQVEVFDQTGNPITCGNYLVTAPGNGLVQSTVVGYTDCWYKPWTPVSINLVSYIGQNIRIKFTAGDCTQGGHFGYAYVDATCASYTINPVTICRGSSATLTAPGGALNYSWTPGGATTASIVVSPTVTTNYTCAVTSQGTTPCTGNLTTTVTVLASPTVTVNSPTVCAGQGGVLTASVATTYAWSPGTGLSSTTASVVTATPASTTVYTVTGSNGTCSTTATSTVTVIPTPTLTVNSPTICKGNSTTLNASGATTYSWSPATGLSATTGASVTANPTVTTTYTIVGTVGSCTTSVTSLVTVSPIPTVSVNSPTICNGSSTTLTAAGATTYSWSAATGLSGTTGASVTASPTTTTTYTIVGTTATCTSSITSVVTVNPLPTVTVNNPTYCTGGSAVLTASGATTYSWSPAGGLSATTGSTVTANPVSTTTYTVVGTSATCTAAVTSVVTVVTTPTVTVNSPTICRGNSTTLTASGATTYSWSPGTGLSATSGTSVTANPTVTTTYTITGTAGTCSSTTTSTVTVSPNPTVTVNSPTLCVGASSTLTATGATTYSWTPATGLSATTGASVTANPTITTTYTVTGTTATCTNTATSLVTVNPLPTVTVGSATICPGASTALTAAGASTYTWANAATLSSSTGTSVTASPTVTTTYTITGTSAAGCVGTGTVTLTIGGAIVPSVNSPTICAGNSAALNASGGTTYTWSPATGLSGTSGSSVTANPTVTTTYTITAASGSCTGTTTAVVTVNPMPTVTVNSPSICVGNNSTLTATGATTYSWSPATGLSTTTGASVTANPTVTTTYTVVGTSATCTAQATSIVTVNPLPTVTVNSATVCPGASATLTAAGASTYTWSTTATGASITDAPVATTNYTVTGTSASGCVNTATASITVLSALTVSVNSATLCIGNSSSLTASGASTYTWNPATGLSASTGASVTANPASTTVYTVTGSSGTCSATATSTVTVNPLPVVTVNTGTICAGVQTATLTAGGASTYSWNPATGLSATTGAVVTANPAATTAYTVTGTDANGCVNTNTTAVTVNPLPTITINAATICGGGSAVLTANGASTYTWSPGTGLSGTTGTSVTANPPTTTNYTISATDANGCTDSDTTTLTVVTNPTVTVNTATLCVGATATLTAGGASTYVWSPGTGLSSTTGGSVTANPTTTTAYTITGIAGTCTTTATTTVTVNPLPVVTVNTGTICIGQQTSTLTAAGASTYSWTPSTGLSASTGAIVTANPGATISYTVTGIDANGCVNTNTTAVTVNPLPTLTLNSGFICNGSTAVLNAGGASTYVWSPATGLSATTGASVNANPLTTTNYTITGTDANGCVNSDTTSVTVVSNPTVTVNTGTICIGQQTATLTANGAVTYVWNPVTGLSSGTGTSVTANPASTTVYTVTGTAGTCTAVATTTVTVNPLPIITVNTNTICIGQQTATLTAGGASTYNWNPSTGLSASSGTSVTANPAITTDYTVTGTDVNGCVNTNSTTVTVNPLPTIILNSALVCNGASTTLNAAGAVTYNWAPGTGLSTTTGASVTANPLTTTNYTITGTDANGCVNSDTTTVTVVSNPVVTVNSATICLGQQTATLTANGAATYVWDTTTGLSSGTGTSVTANPVTTTVYTITGTVGTCTAVNTCTVTVNTLPVVTVNTGTICIGQQTATLNAGGASTYSWTPATGLSASTGASVTANPAITTPYTVTGTDINGCVSSNTTAVTVNPLPTITVNSATICPTFTGTLTAAGASSYAWNTGATTSTITDSPATTTSYTVVGTDVNGCISGNTATITVNPSLVITAATNSPICEGATLNLTTTAGVSWSWTGPGLYTSTSQNPSILGATPAMSGTYSVTATDANGCQGSATTLVTVNPLPVITVGSNSPVCVNQTLNLTSTGGPGYAWSGPNSFSSTAQNPTIPGITLAANGTYSLTVTDANTCVSTATLAVVINPLPVVTASGTTVCIGATINLSSGGGIVYSWSGPNAYVSNSQNPVIPNADATMAGNYVVTAADGNGCVNAAVATVAVNSLPNVSATSGIICIGNSTTLTASGAFSYNWTPTIGLSASTGTSVNAAPNITTTYSVIGTDVNGCKDTSTTIVTVNPLPVLDVTPPNSSGCAPVCVTFSNTSTATGTCGWVFGDGTTSSDCAPNHCFTGQGTFFSIFTLTDANGCTNTDTAQIVVYPMPIPDFSFEPQPTDVLDAQIYFTNLSSGAIITGTSYTFGDPGHGYSNFPNPSYLYLDPGTYPVQLVATTDHGCKDSVTKNVVIGEIYSIYVPNAFSPNADGVNDFFWAKGEGIKDFHMYIFDRWGNQVFYSNDIYKGWDGRFQSKGETIVQEDVYVWKIELKNFKNESKMLKGTVSLIK